MKILSICLFIVVQSSAWAMTDMQEYPGQPEVQRNLELIEQFRNSFYEAAKGKCDGRLLTNVDVFFYGFLESIPIVNGLFYAYALTDPAMHTNLENLVDIQGLNTAKLGKGIGSVFGVFARIYSLAAFGSEYDSKLIFGYDHQSAFMTGIYSITNKARRNFEAQSPECKQAIAQWQEATQIY